MILSNAQVRTLRESLLETAVWSSSAKAACMLNRPAGMYMKYHDEAAKKVNAILGADTIKLYNLKSFI